MEQEDQKWKHIPSNLSNIEVVYLSWTNFENFIKIKSIDTPYINTYMIDPVPLQILAINFYYFI